MSSSLGRAERVPAVAVPHHATQEPLVQRARAEPESHALGAQWLRLEPHVLERVEPPRERHRRRLPGRLPRGQVLVEQRAAVGEGDAERAVLGLVPADGGEDDEAAPGEEVERREILREQQRVPERRDDRGRGEPERRRRGGDRREEDERARPRHRRVLVAGERVVARVRHRAVRVRAPAEDDVLAHHHRVEAGVLRLLRHAHERAEVVRRRERPVLGEDVDEPDPAHPSAPAGVGRRAQ